MLESLAHFGILRGRHKAPSQMAHSTVPVIVLSTKEDDVEFINRLLREAGHAVRCRWIARGDELVETLEQEDVELIWLFADRFGTRVREVAKLKAAAAERVPLIVVQETSDEDAIAEAMQSGAQDLVSAAHTDRVRAVAERELRAHRLERALNDTLVSASQYKRQLKEFMAGAVDAIAHAQEGILVDANQAWAETFGHADPEAMMGPLMDQFDPQSQAALKGAVVACEKGHWNAEPINVIGLTGDRSKIQLKLVLESAHFEDEPAIKLSVIRERVEQKTPEALLEQAVHTDPLTGFFHRRRFIELVTDRLDATSRGGVRALAYLRPDKFGEVEDEVGPVASEDVLVQMAGLLGGLVHPNDLCGRFGGNVFAMIIERGTLRDVEAWAENVVTRMAEQIFEVASHTLALTCTIGLAEIAAGADRVEHLIRDAERANQRGRKRGGNQVVLEETSDEGTRIQRFDEIWTHQIRSALVENRFRLVHLPIASLTGTREIMYDTVLRMVDPEGNETPASDFMPAAARNRMLRAVDRWVIGASIDHLAQHKIDRLFVKLSSESVTDTTLVDWITQRIKEKGVAPSQLCFQVSEEIGTQFTKPTGGLAEDLKNGGYLFALEHFGIGRSPLRVLGNLPVNFVKIDGSLMQSIATDLGLQEKVRGFVQAADKRKIPTIAERVEDANTMAVLFQLGVAYMQGHYLQEPEVILEEA